MCVDERREDVCAVPGAGNYTGNYTNGGDGRIFESERKKQKFEEVKGEEASIVKIELLLPSVGSLMRLTSFFRENPRNLVVFIHLMVQRKHRAATQN
jgi:hypothetical protein